MTLRNKKIKIILTVVVPIVAIGAVDYFAWYKAPADCGTIETPSATAYDTNVKVSQSEYSKLSTCFTKRYFGLRSTKISIENKQKDSGNTYIFTYKGMKISGVSDSFNQYGSAKFGFGCSSAVKTQSSMIFTCQNGNFKYVVSSI